MPNFIALKHITRNIVILSLVSLFTDMAGELLYPVIPVYLQSIGFTVVFIGILEGVAEAIAGLSKGYFGAWSDRIGHRAIFVRTGYAISALSKPLMVMFANVWWVLGSRSLDRLGKGIRTGARDAILTQESSEAGRAGVFGFHRSMDTLGAVIGPLLALYFLYLYPGNYKLLFYLAIIPGLASIALAFLLKEKPSTPKTGKTPFNLKSNYRYIQNSPIAYRRLLWPLLLFALVNSSDIFLLLMVKTQLNNDQYVIGLYIFYNLIYALFSWPAGSLADMLGVKKIFITGLLLFALSYAGMVYFNGITGFCTIFFIYGLYAATTEGISKAWISKLVKKDEMAGASGTYAGFQSICTLFASSITGAIWYNFGPAYAFGFTAAIALLVAIYILIRVPEPKPVPEN